MLRRHLKSGKRTEENAESIIQRKRDTQHQAATDVAAQLLRDKDVNQKRGIDMNTDPKKRDKDITPLTSPTQKTRIKVLKDDLEDQKSIPRNIPQVKARRPLGSTTPVKRPLKDEYQPSPKRVGTSQSRAHEAIIPEDATEDIQEGLVPLPEVELDLSLLDDDDCDNEKDQTTETIEENLKEAEQHDNSQQTLPTEVEYAGTKEEELPTEPDLKVDVSGFGGSLPNIGAYEIGSLHEPELEFEDEDVPVIMTGKNATIGDEREDVFLLLLPTKVDTDGLLKDNKDHDELDIPFRDDLFDVDEYEKANA